MSSRRSASAGTRSARIARRSRRSARKYSFGGGLTQVTGSSKDTRTSAGGRVVTSKEPRPSIVLHTLRPSWIDEHDPGCGAGADSSESTVEGSRAFRGAALPGVGVVVAASGVLDALGFLAPELPDMLTRKIATVTAKNLI